MDSFVQHLADLCRAHVTRAKCVFVRTHAVGTKIGERIAFVDTGYLGVHFELPHEFAWSMAARDNLVAGHLPVPEEVVAALTPQVSEELQDPALRERNKIPLVHVHFDIYGWDRRRSEDEG